MEPATKALLIIYLFNYLLLLYGKYAKGLQTNIAYSVMHKSTIYIMIS